jgi:hypothetical protein
MKKLGVACLGENDGLETQRNGMQYNIWRQQLSMKSGVINIATKSTKSSESGWRGVMQWRGDGSISESVSEKRHGWRSLAKS